MWEHQFFELFTTIIPQSFLFIFLLFSLVGIKIGKRIFFIISITIAIIAYLLRPYVGFGVHSAITLVVLILIAAKWGRANILISFLYSVIVLALGYVSEWITFIILELFSFNIELLNTSAKVRAIVGTIPLTIFFIISLAVYNIRLYNKKKDNSMVQEII